MPMLEQPSYYATPEWVWGHLPKVGGEQAGPFGLANS